jgi:hypothetical protein
MLSQLFIHQIHTKQALKAQLSYHNSTTGEAGQIRENEAQEIAGRNSEINSTLMNGLIKSTQALSLRFKALHPLSKLQHLLQRELEQLSPLTLPACPSD